MDKIKKPKNKFTMYLTEEADKMFNELYAFRLMAGNKKTKSDIVCQALVAMHNREFNKYKSEDSDE